MGAVNRAVMPASIAPPAARYAHAVLSEAPARLLHISGQVPVAPDGTIPADIGDQAGVVWANIAAILAEAGMAITDVVAITTYVVAGHDLAPVMAARDAACAGHLVASTLVTVPGLVRPEWLVEVAVVAAGG
jgi:2-iminobutanoate/2-iminopropanoate deaminase